MVQKIDANEQIANLTAIIQDLIDSSLLSSSKFTIVDANKDCSSEPNYPSANKADVLYIAVAGKIGGSSGKTVKVGDIIVALQANAGGSEASVGTYWFILAAGNRGVTNGDSHDHNGGDGAQVNHTILSNIGTNTHANIDTYIAGTTTHVGVTSSGSALFALDTSGGATMVIADNAIATPTGNSANFAGMVLVRDMATDGTTGLFMVGGSFSSLAAGNTTTWSDIKDTANKINVYQDAANSYVLTIQNKSGVSRTIRVVTLRLDNAA